MKVLSLYCGAGGIDEGLKQAGIKTTLAIDIDKHCCNTMKLNHDCEVLPGEVSTYLDSFGKQDIVVGGPPCPQFSRANPGRKYDMTEIDNFWIVVKQTRPKTYMMENVQDMATYLHKHNFLLDTADYGIPQNRMRRFFTNLEQPKPTHMSHAGYLPFGMDEHPLPMWKGISDTLNLKPDEKFIFDHKYSTRNMIELTREVSRPCFTITTNHSIKLVSKNIYSEKYTGIKIPPKIGRPLTNEEAAKLQAFPDEYQFSGGLHSIRKQIGNAVPPPIIKAFFQDTTQSL